MFSYWSAEKKRENSPEGDIPKVNEKKDSERKLDDAQLQVIMLDMIEEEMAGDA